MYVVVERKLASGEVILLDGSLETSLSDKGIYSPAAGWSDASLREHGQLISSVHSQYIETGCDVITASNLASYPLLFSGSHQSPRMQTLDRLSSQWVREAIERSSPSQEIAIAGCFGVTPVSAFPYKAVDPRFLGRELFGKTWTFSEVKPLFEAKAESLLKAGYDMIIIEMARDVDYSLWATEIAVSTGLPVWIGVCVEQITPREMVGIGRQDWPFDDIVSTLMATGAQACFIMHTSVSDTTNALNTMKRVWAGPVGVCPHGNTLDPRTGHLSHLKPDDYVEECRRWLRMGASIFGGSQKIGINHLAALTHAFKRKSQEEA